MLKEILKNIKQYIEEWKTSNRRENGILLIYENVLSKFNI